MSPPDAPLLAPGVPLGAPGVYVVPEPRRAERLGVPMDECAFVGVAPRGPAFVRAVDDDGPTRAQATAVAVRSWDEYRQLFGAFEGPGLLPFAVSTFFEQGGRIAHVARVVARATAPGGEPLARARHVLGAEVETTGGAPVAIWARDEGSWGRRLSIRFRFGTTALPFPPTVMTGRELTLGPAPLALGTLLRLTADDGSRVLAAVDECIRRVDVLTGARAWAALLDRSLTATIEKVEIVDGALDVVDADLSLPRRERFERLGLRAGHPRWAADVIAADSRLVELAADVDLIRPTIELDAAASTLDETTGADRYAEIDTVDVLDAGVPAALAVRRVASVVVPDLYSPGAIPPPESIMDPPSLAGSTFEECVTPVEPAGQGTPPPAELTGLLLDPLDPDDLDAIGDRQGVLIAAAGAAGVVALVDVPPGITHPSVLRWRRRFASSYAAAYHPWLLMPRDGARGTGPLVRVPPSAVAAGIIARVERRDGLAHGPANEVATSVVDVTAAVAVAEHAALHWDGVDVFVREPRGIVLTGARTLATDRTWRQLTVRRIVTMIERAVAEQLQWVVFEPNDVATRRAVAADVDDLMRRLFHAGSFAGATFADSFFVRTASSRQLSREQDSGELLCEIGVAPSEPMEFLLVRVTRVGDATVRAESVHG